MNSQFTEAPASINIKAIAPGGFDVMITLRDAESAKLMPRLMSALDWLEQSGFQPTGKRYANGGGNGTGPMCPTHGKPMKASKHGGYYCTVKIADDGGDGRPVYCKQKAK